MRRERGGVVVGIVGCMAERLKDKLLDTHKVDLVAGPDSYRTLPALLRDIAPDKPQINVMLSHEETYADIVPVRTDRNGVSAFISIMRGATMSARTAWCLTPGARREAGTRRRSWTRRGMFQQGLQEVTCSVRTWIPYNWKPEDGQGCRFPDLLEMVPGSVRNSGVRFGHGTTRKASPVTS